MGNYIAYCSYYESQDSDVLHELSRECLTKEDAQNALVELMDVASDRSIFDECDVFEKEDCEFEGTVWRPTNIALDLRDGAIIYNERMRKMEAYRVRFVVFKKKTDSWFAHVVERPMEQLKMDGDNSIVLDYLAQRSREQDSMTLVLAGEYPYDDSEIRLTKVHQDEFSAVYKVERGRYYFPYELEERYVELRYSLHTLFDGFPPHIDILDIQ